MRRRHKKKPARQRSRKAARSERRQQQRRREAQRQRRGEAPAPEGLPKWRCCLVCKNEVVSHQKDGGIASAIRIEQWHCGMGGRRRSAAAGNVKATVLMSDLPPLLLRSTPNEPCKAALRSKPTREFSERTAGPLR